jgi:hypothetical protein
LSCRCDSSSVPRAAAPRQKEEHLDVEKLVAEVAAKALGEETIPWFSWLREIGAQAVQGGAGGTPRPRHGQQGPVTLD